MLLILLIVYRNPVTMLVPLITIGISLAVAQGVLAGLAQLGLGVMSETIVFMTAVMVGAGTDYAVFLMSRYHDYVRLGVDSDQAVKRALASIGKVIAASAATVAVTCLAMIFCPIAGIFNSWSGNFNFDCCGVRCCGESASRHSCACRTAWLDQAATRPHRSFLAAFGHTHCAPAKNPSGRQCYRTYHAGQLRERWRASTMTIARRCRVLPTAPSDMPRWIAISRRTRSFLSSSSFSHHTTCGTPKPSPTSSRWHSG